MPSHYQNQCWLIVNWNLRDTNLSKIWIKIQKFSLRYVACKPQTSTSAPFVAEMQHVVGNEWHPSHRWHVRHDCITGEENGPMHFFSKILPSWTFLLSCERCFLAMSPKTYSKIYSYINSLGAIFQKKYQHVFTVYIIIQQWMYTDSWNPPRGRQ